MGLGIAYDPETTMVIIVNVFRFCCESCDQSLSFIGSLVLIAVLFTGVVRKRVGQRTMNSTAGLYGCCLMYYPTKLSLLVVHAQFLHLTV